MIHLAPTVYTRDLYPEYGHSSDDWDIHTWPLCGEKHGIQQCSPRKHVDCQECLVTMDRYLDLGLIEVTEILLGWPPLEATEMSWCKGVVFAGRIEPLEDTWGSRKWDWEPWLEQSEMRDENIYSSINVGQQAHLRMEELFRRAESITRDIQNDFKAQRRLSQVPPSRHNVHLFGAQYLDGRLGKKRKKAKK